MTILRKLSALLMIVSLSADAGLFDRRDQASPGFMPAEEAFVLSALAVGPDTIEAQWDVAPGYYLYRHRLQFDLMDGGRIVSIELPEGQAKHDEHFGAVEVYYDRLVAALRVTDIEPGQELTLQVSYQGCAEAGLCYPPRSQQLPIVLPESGS